MMSGDLGLSGFYRVVTVTNLLSWGKQIKLSGDPQDRLGLTGCKVTRNREAVVLGLGSESIVLICLSTTILGGLYTASCGAAGCVIVAQRSRVICGAVTVPPFITFHNLP